MLYCKWTGLHCPWVDPETGDCGAVNGKCVKEEIYDEQ